MTKRAKRRTTKPAATHCVLVTTVCWYASSVTAVPTHPIKNPLRFRSMPLAAAAAACCRLFSLPIALWLLSAGNGCCCVWRRRDEGFGSSGWGIKAEKSTAAAPMRGPRSQLIKGSEGRGAVFKFGKRRFGMRGHLTISEQNLLTALNLLLRHSDGQSEPIKKSCEGKTGIWWPEFASETGIWWRKIRLNVHGTKLILYTSNIILLRFRVFVLFHF